MSVRNPIVIAAACAVLGGVTAAMPVSASASAGGVGRAAAPASAAGMGMQPMIVPAARQFAAADGPPTSAECLANLGVPCYSPLQGV